MAQAGFVGFADKGNGSIQSQPFLFIPFFFVQGTRCKANSPFFLVFLHSAGAIFLLSSELADWNQESLTLMALFPSFF